MNSRVDKYYDKNVSIGSRTARNSELYKDISKTEIEGFDIQSNATVIGNSKNNIDVEKIKSILDTHYNDAPKRHSIRLDEQKVQSSEKPTYETKEYDINVILTKAHAEKVDDYNENRNKKLRDTQYDILNNLNLNDFIENYEHEKPQMSPKEDLQKLIDTIALNEKEILEKKKQMELAESKASSTDPLELFSDLKGSDDTMILEGLQEVVEEENEEQSNKMEVNPEDTALDKSFFTQNNSFKENDFEDFEEIDDKPLGLLAKIIIFLIIAIFVAGLFILVKSFL